MGLTEEYKFNNNNRAEGARQQNRQTIRGTGRKRLMDIHWTTPKELYDELNKEFKFELDPCPLNSTHGLDIKWAKSNFVNPPYDKKNKTKFVLKALEESKKGNTSVLLIPVVTSSRLFHEIILPNAEIRFLKGRTQFLKNGIKKCHNNFDTMIVIFRGKPI